MDKLKEIVDAKNHDKFDKKIVNRQFLLGKYYDATMSSFMRNKHKCNHKKFPKSKSQKLMTNQMQIVKEIRGQQEYQLEQQKYEFYLPLNQLWKRYMKDLIDKEVNQESRELKVLRGDFYGAYITVLECKNDNIVGVSGIVIRESLRTFQIIQDPTPLESQEGNQITPTINKPIITVLKSICIFLVKVGEQYTFIINGNSLVYRPSDRIKHKFKFKKGEHQNFKFLSMLGQIEKEEASQK